METEKPIDKKLIKKCFKCGNDVFIENAKRKIIICVRCGSAYDYYEDDK